MRAPYPTNLKTSKPEDFSPLQAMEHAALFDNKEEYIKGFKNWPSDKDIRHETWSYMFQYDSVKCATAVLDGETDGRLNLVAAVSDYGSSLLHEAAKFEAYNITAMLLDRGESADTEVNKLLPLELVMRTLMPYYIFTRESERMRGRDPEMSVFQTIVMLSAERSAGQGILNSKYQGSFTYGQQVPGPLTWNSQGAPSLGLRSFHSSSFRKPDRGVGSSFLKADRGIASSSQLKSSYNAAAKFVCSKQFSVYLMALRRGLRHM